MKTAVLVVCLFGLAYTYPSSSESNSSPQDSSPSISRSDSSPSSSEEAGLPTPGNGTQIMYTERQLARGFSLRRKRAAQQSVSSSESVSKSVSNSSPDTSSSSEEVSVSPSTNGATNPARGDSLRRKRAADPNTSSVESSESVTTESVSIQSRTSSEEDSPERITKQNLLQGVKETSTVPDTSEESSEERTTPAFQP